MTKKSEKIEKSAENSAAEKAAQAKVAEEKVRKEIDLKMGQIKIAQKELQELKKLLPEGSIIRHGSGVISTIAELLKSSNKGISRPQILAKLMEKFPERGEEQMKATVSVQVPSRINKERFELEKLEGGLFRAKFSEVAK